MRPIHAEGVARAVKRGKFLDCASNSASRGIPLDRTIPCGHLGNS